MRILVIGDVHGNLEKIKKIPIKNIDLILLTGDLGKADLVRKIAFEDIERKKRGLPEIKYTKKHDRMVYREIYDSSINILKYLSKFAPVYTIYGNIEPQSSKDKIKYKKLRVPFLTDALRRMKDVKIINNRLVKFNGIRIGGLQYFIDMSWIREFKPDDYQKRLKKSRRETDKTKRILKWFNKLDILLCHQPPYGVLDKVNAKFAPEHWKGKHAGSKTILDYIKRKQPRYVFCGHIHEGKGKKEIGKTIVYNLGVVGYKIVDL